MASHRWDTGSAGSAGSARSNMASLLMNVKVDIPAVGDPPPCSISIHPSNPELGHQLLYSVAGNNEDLPLIEGLEDLHEKEGYFGGIANGLGLQQEHLRELDRFLDEKPDHEEDDIDEDNDIDAGPSVWVAHPAVTLH
ncbi:hypothetical protein L210DRAFT_990031 [Boletus edulis BED1]|uniref:Uncharacterized protein n=1 Tax=Boletus edulis BED1 TaxID=1328754 RepID=A0AAD4BDW3_BOLED|nr:hypothetical protein L210DRAFT_990031 [Boletus edulis BED1]